MPIIIPKNLFIIKLPKNFILLNSIVFFVQFLAIINGKINNNFWRNIRTTRKFHDDFCQPNLENVNFPNFSDDSSKQKIKKNTKYYVYFITQVFFFI